VAGQPCVLPQHHVLGTPADSGLPVLRRPLARRAAGPARAGECGAGGGAQARRRPAGRTGRTPADHPL